MADIKLSPLEGGFTNTAPSIDLGSTAKQWFEKIFDPKHVGVQIDLDRYVIFDQKDLRVLVDQTNAIGLCFSKQKLTKNKNTIVAAATYNGGQTRELHTDSFYVGNSFSQELAFQKPKPTTLSTEWQVNICDQETFKVGIINLVWENNYWIASTDTSTTTRYFLTVSFNRTQIEKILKGATKVGFARGFVDLTIANHTPECNEIGPKIRIEILTAFGLNAKNEIISDAYLPTESWPVKYPPYSGAGDGPVLSFGQKLGLFFKKLFS